MPSIYTLKRPWLKEPVATFNREHGQITFNKAAVKAFKLEQCKGVLLSYSRKNNAIYIQPKKEHQAAHYRMHAASNGRMKIRICWFLNYYGIERKGSFNYKVEWDDENKRIVLKMENPLPTTRRK